MSNKTMVVVTKKADGEAQAYKTLVAISSSDNKEFTKQVAEELHRNGTFSIMHNPAARNVAQRTRNFSFTLNEAVKVDADMVVCVSCRKPDSAKDIRLEESEKGGFKPVINVLSPKLLETTAVCKDVACVNKFPGEMEQSIWGVIDEFSKAGVKRIPLEELRQRMQERVKEESATHHWIRRALRHMSEDKVIAEIEVFPKNEEETARAAKDCATIVCRLHDFNSKKRDADDERLFLGEHPPHLNPL